MTWLLSYVWANFALIAVVTLAVVGLGLLAFFLKNWKAALIAVVILGAGFGYMWIDKNAYQRRVSEEAAEKVSALENHIQKLNVASEADSKRAAEDAIKIAELEAKANETPANNGACLDIDSARRVRDIK
jgi:predicted negative regulator of RcsB-dependent stress response